MIEVRNQEAEVKSLGLGSYLRDEDEHFVTLALKLCPQRGDIPVADAAASALQPGETAQIQIPAQTDRWDLMICHDGDVVICTATVASSTCGVTSDGPVWLSVKLKARVKAEHLPRLARMAERTARMSAWPLPEEEPEEKPPTPKAAPLVDYLAERGATLEISVQLGGETPAAQPAPVTVDLSPQDPVADAAASLGGVAQSLTPSEPPTLAKRHTSMLAKIETAGGTLANPDDSTHRATLRELLERGLVSKDTEPCQGGHRVLWRLVSTP